MATTFYDCSIVVSQNYLVFLLHIVYMAESSTALYYCVRTTGVKKNFQSKMSESVICCQHFTKTS